MLLEEAGVAKRTVTALNKKKVYTVDDLLRCIPRKYLDYREIVPFSDAVGKDCAIAGYIQSAGKKEGNGRPQQIDIDLVEETSGQMVKIYYFGTPYIWEHICKLIHKEVIVCGKISNGKFGYSITNPYRISDKELFHGTIVPVYSKMKGVSEDMLKKLIKTYIKDLSDPIEENVISRAKLFGYKEALQELHYPTNFERIQQARKRLAFNDLLFFSMQLQEDADKIGHNGIKIDTVEETVNRLDKLPFQLTEDQAVTLNHIRDNMKSGVRTDALIQGDVGCGKTIVAFLSMSMMAENGYQSAIMAPTEILAHQHYDGFCKSFPDLASKAVFLSGSMKVKEKKEALSKIVAGEALFVIGTHSVISKNVMFYKLGLVITDEEHRFGTEQRDMLMEKGNEGVHIITMSATPIPRSIAAVMYGENKAIYEIKSMPDGRIPVQTAINNNQQKIFDFAEKQLKENRQIYVVCPLVDEAEEGSSSSGMDSVQDVYERYRLYFETIGYKTGKLFGKQDNSEKAANIKAFEENKVQILVSTTVVEVGVNVPNASLIIIHNAERFGLATMHQLRGRVGRGGGKSYCILKSDQRDNERLLTMVNTTDGFKIAEEDMKQRGIGDLIGTKQSGKNHNMDLMLSYPNFYKAVKKYARWMLESQKAEQLVKLYMENASAAEKKGEK
jgi:ATP-dependent DNA helicase RecG